MWMDTWALDIPFDNWFVSPCSKNNTANHRRAIFRCFPIYRPVVVLSNSNVTEKEVNQGACEKHNIPILRRKGGGGTVLLSKGTVVLTLAFYAKDVFQNSRYFSLINKCWSKSIEDFTGITLEENGYSDLSRNDKKLVGTSLFRSKHFLLYQGSLLVDADFSLMEEVLKHPSREPVYRKNRSHKDFLTTLKIEGYSKTPEELANYCQEWFKANFFDFIKDEFHIFS